MSFALMVTAFALELMALCPTAAQAVCADPSLTPRLDVPTVTCVVGQPCTVSINLSLDDFPNEERVKTASGRLTSDKAITCTACNIESPAGYGNCVFNSGNCSFFLGDAFDPVKEFGAGTLATILLTCDETGIHNLDLTGTAFVSPGGMPMTGCGQAETIVCGTACNDDMDCAGLDDQCNVGVCDGGTGTCMKSPRSDGTPCNDGDACTASDACDGQGVCLGGSPPVCDDGNVCNGAETCDALLGCQPGTLLVCDDGEICTDDSCDAVQGCQFIPNSGNDPTCSNATTTTTTTTTVPSLPCGPIPEPDAACNLADANGALKSSVQIKDKADDAKDRFKWKWNKGVEILTSQFGTPDTSSNSYRVCLYDSSGLLRELELPPGGLVPTCGSKPCWKTSGSKGFKYKNKTATPDGITGAKFKSGTAGKSKVQIKAKGANLLRPPTASLSGVVVQLIIDDGGGKECFKTTVPNSAISKQDAGNFKARAPAPNIPCSQSGWPHCEGTCGSGSACSTIDSGGDSACMCVPGTTPCRSDTFAPICGGDCVSGELCVSFFSSCDCFEDCPGSCAAGSTCTSGVGPSVGNTFCVGDAQGRILCTGCTP